jgi:hypothetical protein
MREIKFRVWAVHEKRWIGYEQLSPNPEKPETLEWHKDDISLKLFFGGVKGLIRCQFTGLKDAKGIEIYEGDIIHGLVITDTPYTAECPSLQYFHWYQELEDAIEEGKQIDVIGNIYENPDLLNV